MNDYSQMTNQQLVNEFNDIWKKSNVSRSNINRYVKNHHSALYVEIEKRTMKLNQYKIDKKHNGKLSDISIFERLFCLEHGLDDRPLCIECKINHVAGFMPYENAYAQYCSQNCQKHSSIQAQRGLESRRKKYGEDNIVNQRKAKETRFAKYGSYHPDDQTQKTKMIKKRKYGDENYTNVDKIKQTVEKHKSENPNYYYEREQKTKQTKVRNGHDPNWNNREKIKHTLSLFTEERKEQIKNTRKQTCLREYGCEYVMQNPEIALRSKNAIIDKYGVKSLLNLPSVHESAVHTIRKKSWKLLMSRNLDIEPLFTEEEYIKHNVVGKEWPWRCKKCGHVFIRSWKNINMHCPKCFVLNYHSMQNEVHEYICSICSNDKIVRDDRKTFNNALELDILDQTQHIAIEFNGLTWHNVDKQIYSGRNITRAYHFDKSNKCEALGIRLVHIFEDEWIKHKQLCKSKLKKMFAQHKVKSIDAHSCILSKSIDQLLKEKLLAKYTFFGNDGSSIAYTLKFHDHIVAMMTFSKTRKDRSHEWHVLNYVELNSFIVKNGFEVLLNGFCKDNSVKNISYYASRDWISKEDIKCMDFVEVKAPRAYWIKKQSRFKLSYINESNIKDFVHSIDISKTFLQNMNNNRFYRLYDSGVLMFELRM